MGTPRSLDPWSSIPPSWRGSRAPGGSGGCASSLLTSSLASPSTKDFLCLALLELKDLHFKGVLEWIWTDTYLQVLFFQLLPL